MDRFTVGEVAVYWRPGHTNHRREVTIDGPLERDITVQDSWTGAIGTLTGHVVVHGSLTMGPHAATAKRAFVALHNLRKKQPPADGLKTREREREPELEEA